MSLENEVAVHDTDFVVLTQFLMGLIQQGLHAQDRLSSRFAGNSS